MVSGGVSPSSAIYEKAIFSDKLVTGSSGVSTLALGPVCGVPPKTSANTQLKNGPGFISLFGGTR